MFQNVVYRTRSQADRYLGIQDKQQFILESQKDNLWISPKESYQIDVEWCQMSKLGSGAYGECFMAKDNTSNFTFCIKSILGWSYPHNCKDSFREAHILCRLQHPKIVDFYGVLFNRSHFRILMKYAHGKSLSECFDGDKTSSLQLCLHILRQLLECLVYLEEKNITHGDIRFDNIMITCDGSIQLVDFGIATLQFSGEVESVLSVFIHLVALSFPWRVHYDGTTLLRKVLDTHKLPSVGPPGMPLSVKGIIKDGFGAPPFSAEQLLNMVTIDFINEACMSDAHYREPVDLGFEARVETVEGIIPSTEIPSTVEELINTDEGLQ